MTTNKKENWEERFYEEIGILHEGLYGELGDDVTEKVRSFIKEVRVEAVEEALNKLWIDEGLQQAITDYGEWNDRQLNIEFEAAKRRILLDDKKEI